MRGFVVRTYARLIENEGTLVVTTPIAEAIRHFGDRFGAAPDVLTYVVPAGEADGIAAEIEDLLGLAPIGTDEV